MRTVALAAAALLALAGCTIDTPEPQAPEPTTSTPTSTTAAPLEESDKVDPPVSETPPEPAPVEPTISYCGEMFLHQTGTTFYTDGTSGWTQYCANQMSAEQAESNYYENGCSDGTLSDSECGREPTHNGIPYADGGNCPAYLCGYGTDASGNPNPTSGELQFQRECELGNIDPAICNAQ